MKLNTNYLNYIAGCNMSKWKEYKLGDLIKDIAAGPFGSNLKVECFVESGFPIIDGANLKGVKVTDNITKYVTEEKARSLHRAIAKKNDVVVTISGNVGQIAYIPDNSKYLEYLVSQRQFRATFDETKVDVQFLVYYFHTRVGQHKILSFANQVGVPALAQPLKNFREIELELPPIEEQKQIAGVLGSLDDKIDLLNRENATLEALAETLFRHYFIENPNPDWKEGTIADLVVFNPIRKLAKGEDAPYVEMANIGTSGYAPSSWRLRPFSSGTKFSNGDSLFARISPCLENGKSAYIDFLSNEQVGWGSTEFIVMHSQMELHPFFAYILTRYDDFRDHAVSSLVGSSGRQRVDLDNLLKYPMAIPDKQTIAVFNREMEVIVPKMKNNKQQIISLSSQRDTLLPRLMSGEAIVSKNNCR